MIELSLTKEGLKADKIAGKAWKRAVQSVVSRLSAEKPSSIYSQRESKRASNSL